MRKVTSLFATIALTAAACVPKVEEPASDAPEAAIFPDYKEVTVPPNIAPLNFSFEDIDTKGVAVLENSGERLTIRSRKGEFHIPENDWRRLTAAGPETKVTLAEYSGRKLVTLKPFHIHVSKDTIDPYVAYRLIAPGYETWNKMGLYQRCLENFSQTPIMTNDKTDRNCMNCHSFNTRDPGTMMFHMRAQNGGTYVWKKGKIEKLNTKTPQTISALVYPYWHPSGDYIAFSVNDIAQVFHSTDPNRIEVYDYKSDVVVYDVNNKQVSTSPMLTDTTRMETFPSFSPDGKTLYFCSSPLPEMPQGYKDVRYSICSIPFDPGSFSFGDKVDTVYNAVRSGKDATFPRVSPDGRFLLFSETAYGCFAIWHKDSQLRMIDLEDGTFRDLDGINGPDADSYHSWSGNSRWIIWASRRIDGLYSRLFIAHIDKDGNTSKPFLLPQESIRHDKDLMRSYNVPEFISGPVLFDQDKMADVAKNDHGINVTFK
ncbi:MAG: PD40 domain-containing protein [Bacteroidales bacterium]|nr:PD40 domain-containing protein [Bacteroidales bacterium]